MQAPEEACGGGPGPQAVAGVLKLGRHGKGVTHTTSMTSFTSPSWAASSTTHPNQVYTCRTASSFGSRQTRPCVDCHPQRWTIMVRALRASGPSGRAAPPGTAPSRRFLLGPESTAHPGRRLVSGVASIKRRRHCLPCFMRTFNSNTLSCFTSMRSSCPCKEIGSSSAHLSWQQC